MPANVSLTARASVTTGFANVVEAVNQYAPTLDADVATNSLNTCAAPAGACRDTWNSGSLNITWASATPVNAPPGLRTYIARDVAP